MKRFALAATILAVCLTGAYAQGKNAGSIRQIDAYVEAVDKIVANRRSRRVVIADVSDENERRPKWRKFASETAFERFRQNSETFTIVYNWKKAGRTVASNITEFSSSGDWVQYAFHYFRTDGSAAMIRTELRTFNGDFIFIQDRYFDVQGRQINKRSKYLDLRTKKPIKATKEIRNESNGYLSDSAYYKSVAKLPFVRLLGGK